MTDPVLEPSWQPPLYREPRPAPLPSPLFPEGSIRTRWYGESRRVTLRQPALEAIVTTLRRGTPSECHRTWRALLTAIAEADVGKRPGIYRTNGSGP